MPFGQVAGTVGKQSQRPVQPDGQLGGAEQSHPGSGQLHRQWQTLHRPADRRHRLDISRREREAGLAFRGPPDEQVHRLGNRQRFELDPALAVAPQRPLTGAQHRQSGTAPHQRGDLGRAGDEPLEAVQHQHDPPVAQLSGDPLHRCQARRPTTAQRLGDQLAGQVRLTQPGKVQGAHVQRGAAAQHRDQLCRQPRLANPTRAGHCDDPMPATDHEIRQRTQLRVPADNVPTNGQDSDRSHRRRPGAAGAPARGEKGGQVVTGQLQRGRHRSYRVPARAIRRATLQITYRPLAEPGAAGHLALTQASRQSQAKQQLTERAQPGSGVGLFHGGRRHGHTVCTATGVSAIPSPTRHRPWRR